MGHGVSPGAADLPPREVMVDDRCYLQTVCFVPQTGKFHTYGMDITERKLAEQAVHESEERYRGLVELSPDAILINRNNRFAFANPAALRLFGASSAEQLLGKSPFDLFHPDYHETIRANPSVTGGTASRPY